MMKTANGEHKDLVVKMSIRVDAVMSGFLAQLLFFASLGSFRREKWKR